MDGVIGFCNELKGNLNADKRITKNGNEDERTRKELIEFLDNNLLSSDERHSRWIAWVEKQGKKEMLNKACKCLKANFVELYLHYMRGTSEDEIVDEFREYLKKTMEE